MSWSKQSSFSLLMSRARLRVPHAQGDRDQFLITLAYALQRGIQLVHQVEEHLQVEQLDALQSYCARVAQNLETFGFAAKWLALESLGICVVASGREWSLRGSIPLAPSQEQGSLRLHERISRM
jgi:hypothetical protein